jgi:hypothetical protein
MEFAYALFSIRPPKGLPILWEAFEADSPASREMVGRFKAADFDLCIVLHNDYVFYPSAFLEYLSSAYDAQQVGELTVHTRKTRSGGQEKAPARVSSRPYIGGIETIPFLPRYDVAMLGIVNLYEAPLRLVGFADSAGAPGRVRPFYYNRFSTGMAPIVAGATSALGGET